MMACAKSECSGSGGSVCRRRHIVTPLRVGVALKVLHLARCNILQDGACPLLIYISHPQLVLPGGFFPGYCGTQEQYDCPRFLFSLEQQAHVCTSKVSYPIDCKSTPLKERGDEVGDG